MLLPEENPLQTLPLSGAYDFIADIYDSYYAYSTCLIPPNMCVEAYATTMSTDGKHNIMPYDESLSYGTSYHGQLVMSSPLSREHPSRSPSVSSDSGKVKPQYTAELDVLCRICGDRASGFHYGVHSCEGCKGFFRRTLKKQLTYRPCQVGSQCKIDQNSRNKCQYCRYQRCLNAGMSQDAVRFGRMPKAEREKLVADKEVLSQSDGKRIVELRSLSDLITAAFREIFSETIFFRHSVSQSSSSVNVDGHIVETDDQLIFDGISSEEFHDRQIFSIYQELILPVMEASVKFAKKLPSFTNIPMHDQILLMKRNGFMVVQVALHTLVDREFVNFLSQRGTIRLSRMSPMLCEEIKSLLERTIQCADRINSMQLHVGELALFCAILLTQESPNLMNPSMVEELQAELIEALMIALKHNHPKQRVLLPRLLVLISDLIQIVEEFKDHLKNGLYDNTEDFTYVKPLLKEIFDLS